MDAERFRARSGGGKPLPHCKALLLCKEVAEDRVTGDLSLRHLLDKLALPAFPGSSTPFAVFVQVYDGIGRYELALEIHDLSDDAGVARATFRDLEFPQRLAKIDIVIPIEAVWLSQPGRYELVVLADGQELSRQYFEAEVKDDREQ